MSNKRIGLRLNSQQLATLERLSAKSGKCPQDILRDWLDSQELDSVEPECVGVSEEPKPLSEGDKLPQEYDFYPHWSNKIGTSTYVYFPDERILAVKKRTANWSQTWYEVVQVFGIEEVKGVDVYNWYDKLTGLMNVAKVLQHPTVKEVLSNATESCVKFISVHARKGLQHLKEMLELEMPEVVFTC